MASRRRLAAHWSIWDVEHIAAYSPQARPLGALVPDLAGSPAEGTGAGGHHDLVEANAWLRDTYTGAQRALRDKGEQVAGRSSRCWAWI